MREVRENDTRLPEYKILDEELDLISIVLLDGQYSNKFDIIEVTKPLDLVFDKSQNVFAGTFENLGAYMYSFDDWQIVNRKHCRIDMRYKVTNINLREEVQRHKIIIAQSDNQEKDQFGRMSVKCFPENLLINVNLEAVKKEDML